MGFFTHPLNNQSDGEMMDALNFDLLDTKLPKVTRLREVVATEIFESNSQEFHKEGLYSSVIFTAPGDKSRDRIHGRVRLGLTVFSPLAFFAITQLKELYTGIMSGSVYAKFDEELKDFVKSDVLDGETGYAFFVKHFGKVVFPKNDSDTRTLYIDMVERNRDKLFSKDFPILPAGLRDIQFSEGRTKEDEVNKLYRSLISVCGSVPNSLRYSEDKSVDSIRWNIQRRLNAVYDYLMDMLDGKTGLFQSRYASRRVAGGTRNVFSSLIPNAVSLDSPNLTDIDTTEIGLYQYIKGTVPLMHYELTKNVLKDMLVDDKVFKMVNKKTLHEVDYRPSVKERDSLRTRDGLEKLINKFGNRDLRHRAAMFGDNYFMLIYQDAEKVFWFNDIRKLPEGFDKKKVRPMTWAELYYLAAAPTESRTRGILNRYPITGIGSVYPSKNRIRVTENALTLKLCDASGNPTGVVLTEFPNTARQSSFIDTLTPHSSMLEPLGADFDGDTGTYNIVWLKDSVEECDRILNSVDHYLKPTGGQWFSSGTMLADWTLRNFY